MDNFFVEVSWPTVLIVLWTIPWTGVALWKAAKNGHKKWFIALLVINSLAVLEIAYIFFFSKWIKSRPSEKDL